MARKKNVRIMVLVEDELLERFARNCLKELGCHPRELRIRTSPVGRGSGE